jgi:hypothetical protein
MIQGATELTVPEASPRRQSDPLVRNGLALGISGAILSISGFAFWAVAARMVTAPHLAEAAALTSLLLFVAGVGQLNLSTMLPALLPGTGRSGRPILFGGYAVAGAASIVLGLVTAVALVSAGGRVPQIGHIGFVLLPVVVLLWAVFTIQDGALAAVGAALWVPVENGAYGVARLALLVPAVHVFGEVQGVIVAWFGPLLLFVIVVNIGVAVKLHGPADRAVATWGSWRIVGTNFLGAISLMAANRLFPFLAVVFLPREQGAELAIVWLFWVATDVMFQNYGAALTVEIVRRPEQRAELARHALGRTLMYAAAIAAVGVLLATPLLRLTLPDGSADAVLALRVMFVALIPRPVLHLSLAVARATGRRAHLATLPFIALVLSLVSVIPGFVRSDLVLVMIGLLVAQTIVALALIPEFLEPVKEGSRT